MSLPAEEGTAPGAVARVAGGPRVAPVTRAPIPFPNASSPVKPVPGTRPEYTPVAEHYRVDIDLSPPAIDGESWRLRISGLVDKPVQLSLDKLRGGYTKRDQFITLACISNPVGHPQGTYPSGATGIDTKSTDVLPL